MKRSAGGLAVLAVFVAMSTSATAQLQERPQLPREPYADVILWNYGENRPERYAAGCLRWGAQTRTWYDICRAGPRRDTVSVRY
jgi:hypothetical protein